MKRVTLPGLSILIGALLGLAILLSSCSDSDSTGAIVNDEGLLAGEPTATTLATIVDYYDDTDSGPAPIEKDANGIPVVRDRLELFLAAGATVEQFNQLLRSVNARIVSMLGGANAIIIQFPDPGTLDGLQAIIDQLQASTLIDKVIRAERTFAANALPSSYSSVAGTDTAQIEPIDHQLAVRMHAAWNARAALAYAGSEQPAFLIFDHFGMGVPGPDSAGNLTALNGFVHGEKDEHGYHVLGIAMSTFDGGGNPRGRVAGVIPSNGFKTLAFDVTDPAIASDSDLLHRIVQTAKTLPRVVLNTSLGFNCAPDENATAGDATNAELNCVESNASEKAHDWIRRVRGLVAYASGTIGGDSLEHRMLHVASAGNRYGVAGYDEAKHASWWNAAALLPNLEVPLVGIDIPNLTNTLAVENRHNNPSSEAGPACLSLGSFHGGNISAIGSNVYSFSGPDASGVGDESDGLCGPNSTSAGACHLSGSSMASPQVAGLAAYIWTLKPNLTVQEVIEIIRASAKDDSLAVTDPSDPNFINTVLGDCDTTDEPAPVIDAYAAVLRVDDPAALQDGANPLKAPVRLAILDVVGNDKAFTIEDLKEVYGGGDNNDPITQPMGTLDYGRHDLNGDGYTAGETRARFDLNMDGAYGSVNYTFNGQDATLNEATLTDLQILCYYAYSALFTDDEEAKTERDTLLAEHAAVCGATEGKIAFASYRDGNYEIYVMNTDGSGQTRLTHNSAFDASPSWSPDRTRIAFTSGRDGNSDIYVMNADGSGQTRLTNNPAVDQLPSWSPDGTQIAFTSSRDGGNYDIYVMNADGSGQTRLTNNAAFEYWPDWSPDGSRIAFAREVGGAYEIFVMNADGSGQINLTNNPGTDTEPSWSPDGTRIAFSSYHDIGYDIYVMNADGSVKTNLTNNLGSDVNPSWSPDGTRIAFASNREGNTDIYVMDADGSGLTRLTNNPAIDQLLSWSP